MTAHLNDFAVSFAVKREPAALAENVSGLEFRFIP